MIGKIVYLLAFYVLLIAAFYMSKLVIEDISKLISNIKTKSKK